MTRRKLQQLSCLRLEEAEALFKAGYYDGAGYLCGSVVGLALKAATCTTLWLDEYPEKRSRLRDAFKDARFPLRQVAAGDVNDGGAYASIPNARFPPKSCRDFDARSQ
jgi:hypothetical protein